MLRLLCLFCSYILLLSGACRAAVLTVSNSYRWKFNSNIHFTTTADKETSKKSKFPLLLLPGFGVGTFHYNRNNAELAKRGYEVYSVDLLGQGKSWPENGEYPHDEKLCYSIDTWTEQIIYFIEEVIGGPVHIVGNSLGGYLSTGISSRRSDLIKSVSLLNPTPFWGFQNSTVWDGILPAPKWIFNFGSRYFKTMRNQKTVNQILSSVYYSKKAIDESLVADIINSASHVGGEEAFTSILFAPKAKVEYEDMIRNSPIPMCLIMGKEDPWITPYWGQRVKRIKPADIPYFELSHTGHCPHHESPIAVNSILDTWVHAVESTTLSTEVNSNSNGNGRVGDLDLSGASRVGHNSNLSTALQAAVGVYEEEEARSVKVQLVDGAPRTLFEKLGQYFHNLELRGTGNSNFAES